MLWKRDKIYAKIIYHYFCYIPSLCNICKEETINSYFIYGHANSSNILVNRKSGDAIATIGKPGDLGEVVAQLVQCSSINLLACANVGLNPVTATLCP